MAKLYDESGKEVPGALTPEEIAAERTAKEAAEKKAADLEATNKRLEEEVNPNWKKVRADLEQERKRAQAAEDQLKAAGVKVGNDTVTLDDMRREAAITAEKTLVDSQRRRALAQYDEKERPVIEKYLEKLTAGEKVTLDNIDSFIIQAERLASPAGGLSPGRRAMAANGRPSITETTENNDYADTEGGKGLADKLGIKI